MGETAFKGAAMSDTTAEIKTDINCRYLADENARLTERKTTFSDASDASNWALSLSGGGIRSATFSLGVMQALARAPLNDAAESSAGANTWLKRFDYLSTVSGGGYIGALFISLFAEKKEADKSSEPTNVTATAPRAVEPLSQANAPVQKVAHPTNEKAESAPIQVEAANAAYKFLEEEPPRRVSMPLEEGAPKGVEGTRSYLARSLEWLRENGRYLTPNGAGDFGYALSLTLRNLLAAHYVIGTIALTAFLLSQLVAAYAYSRECVWPSAMCKMLAQTTLVDANPLQTFVWSPASWLAVSVLMLAVVPLIGAFWVSYPKDGESKNDPSSALNFAVRGYLYVAAVAFASFCFWRASHLSLAILGALVCVSCAVSVVWHWIALPLVSSQRCSVAEERVKLTRWLSIALISTVLLAAFALVETAA